MNVDRFAILTNFLNKANEYDLSIECLLALITSIDPEITNEELEQECIDALVEWDIL